MHKALQGIGGLLCAAGVMLILANVVMRFLGFSTSVNFGDAANFEFILVPFWLIGLAALLIGGACVFGSRWLRQG